MEMQSSTQVGIGVKTVRVFRVQSLTFAVMVKR